MAAEPSHELDTPAFQRALAEALLVPRTLELLIRQPTEFQARFELTAAQMEALSVAGTSRLTEFALDLIDKRVSLIQRFSPALVGLLMRLGVLRDVMREFVLAHPSRSLSEVPHKVVRDCRWFHDFVERWAPQHGSTGAYLTPVLRFERAQTELTSDEEAAAVARECAGRPPELSLAATEVTELRPVLGPNTRMLAFACDIVGVVRRICEGQPLPDEPPGPATTLLMAREPRRRSIRYVRLNERTAALLADCDGTRSVSDLSHSYHLGWAPELSATEALEACWRILSGLLELEILRLLPAPDDAATERTP